jgi:preprotein translocase subunit SecG
MGILRILLVVIEIVASLLLIGVILLQKSKSEGLGLAFGSGMGETLFGSRAGNVLTKITVTLSLVFLANTALLGRMFTTAHEISIIDQRTEALPVSAPMAPSQQPVEAPQAPSVAAPTLLPGSTLNEASPAPVTEVAAPAPAVAAPVEQPQP